MAEANETEAIWPALMPEAARAELAEVTMPQKPVPGLAMRHHDGSQIRVLGVPCVYGGDLPFWSITLPLETSDNVTPTPG